MSVSPQAQLQAIQLLSEIEELRANPAFLAEDVFQLSQVWESEEEFLRAINATILAIKQLASGAVDVASLSYKLSGWSAYHYQHACSQGSPADMRIVFQMEKRHIKMLAFGHRSIPNSIYLAAAQRF